jgi:hypothetical protein
MEIMRLEKVYKMKSEIDIAAVSKTLVTRLPVKDLRS